MVIIGDINISFIRDKVHKPLTKHSGQCIEAEWLPQPTNHSLNIVDSVLKQNGYHSPQTTH